MLPLRLFMENFGSFRKPATIDFHDVDYFVLVGPTGAGKSTVIDAICFALYGTVPRWGNEKATTMALAPSATAGKVALVFESGGRRYGIVRVLARSAKGAVTTREMRLDELDPGVDPGADIEELLGAVVGSIAEGEQVTAAAQRLTGLAYRFFTQCVVLPQGRFAEFLHATASKRQDLLIQLLDAEVYDQIRKQAESEESQARTALQSTRDQLDALTDADEAAEEAAKDRRDELAALGARVRTRVERLRAQGDTVAELQARADAARALEILDSVAMPVQVPSLADDLREAGELVTRLAGEADEREEARARAEDALAELGDKAELTLAHQAHREHRRLTGELDAIQRELVAARADAETATNEVERARTDLEEAEERRQHSRDAHAAVTIARQLAAGEPCPVCLRPVTEIPRHPAPADIETVEREVRDRKAGLDARLERRHGAEVQVSRLEQQVVERENQLAGHADRLRAHPDDDVLERRLTAIEAADRRARQARQDARSARGARDEAVRRCDALRAGAEQALRDLDAARDTVVEYGAPPLDRSDLHAAWSALLAWRDQDARRRRETLDEVGARLAEARRQRDDEGRALRETLAAHDVPVAAGTAAEAIGEAVAVAQTRAEGRLERVRENRLRAAKLTERVRSHESAVRVAHELALRLRANNFEKWLCSEALELLVAEASSTLRDLSEGQFELTLNDKSDIEVVDYAEAGMRRSVRTLSGGETFQASLALALALSDRVAGFGATAARSLDSIFLDEGFGTLDPATLDTVATTLERLADGERVVGVVTHVPALANRVPVRFEISRDAEGSHLEKRTA